MPHTNGKSGQKWKPWNNKRKRNIDGAQDSSVAKILKEKRLLKKRKQELKGQEETMLEQVEQKYQEMLKVR